MLLIFYSFTFVVTQYDIYIKFFHLNFLCRVHFTFYSDYIGRKCFILNLYLLSVDSKFPSLGWFLLCGLISLYISRGSCFPPLRSRLGWYKTWKNESIFVVCFQPKLEDGSKKAVPFRLLGPWSFVQTLIVLLRAQTFPFAQIEVKISVYFSEISQLLLLLLLLLRI